MIKTFKILTGRYGGKVAPTLPKACMHDITRGNDLRLQNQMLKMTYENVV